jgi:hypothetical protein
VTNLLFLAHKPWELDNDARLKERTLDTTENGSFGVSSLGVKLPGATHPEGAASLNREYLVSVDVLRIQSFQSGRKRITILRIDP